MEWKALGEYIRMLRRDRRWKQVDLAARMGTSDSAVSRIEHGRDVTISDLFLLAQAFETDPVSLLGGFLDSPHSGSFRVPTRLNLLLKQAIDAGMELSERGRKDLAFVLAIVLQGQLPPERVALCEQLREVSGVPST